MPSSFIRKHVRGLLRNKFGPSTSLDNDNPVGPRDFTTIVSIGSKISSFLFGISRR